MQYIFFWSFFPASYISIKYYDFQDVRVAWPIFLYSKSVTFRRWCRLRALMKKVYFLRSECSFVILHGTTLIIVIVTQFFYLKCQFSIDESEIFGIGYQCSRWPVTLLNWALFQLVKVSIFHKEITRPRTLRKVLIWYKCRNLNTTSVSSYPANFVCRPGCAQKLLTVSWDKYDLGGKYTSGDFWLIHANLFSSKRHLQ